MVYSIPHFSQQCTYFAAETTPRIFFSDVCVKIFVSCSQSSLHVCHGHRHASVLRPSVPQTASPSCSMSAHYKFSSSWAPWAIPRINRNGLFEELLRSLGSVKTLSSLSLTGRCFSGSRLALGDQAWPTPAGLIKLGFYLLFEFVSQALIPWEQLLPGTALPCLVLFQILLQIKNLFQSSSNIFLPFSQEVLLFHTQAKPQAHIQVSWAGTDNGTNQCTHHL